MRAKLSNFIALDVGSNKIAGIAASIDKRGAARIVSQSLHHSAGFKSGAIINLQSAEDSLMNAIYMLEKDCGRSIKQAAAALSGSGTKSYFVYNKIKLLNHQITKLDIKKLIQKLLIEFKIKDQVIIHYFPIEFNIDDDNYVEDPIGMFGKELGCQLHIITANSAMLMNLSNCFSKCQVELSDVMLAIYASGLSCLTEDEKKLGSIIIDMGSATTSFGIFLSNKLLYSGYIELGSSHITSDIAKIFSTSLNISERLKILYGNANPYPFPFDKSNYINLEEMGLEDNYHPASAITSSHLNEVISSRVEEILLMLKEQYDKVGVDHLIARRVVITGGGAAMRGIKELTSQIFEKHVRIAKPSVIPGFAEDCNPGIYSTAIGIIKYYILKQEKNFLNINVINEEKSLLKKIAMWMKENI